MQLNGTWTKLTRSACASKYPAEITFTADNRYSAKAEVGTLQHPIWDVGTWRAGTGGQLSLSTANDATISYMATLQADVLSVKDPDGCTFDYRRKL